MMSRMHDEVAERIRHGIHQDARGAVRKYTA